MSDGVLKDIQNMLETPSMRQGGLPTISSVPCTRKCSTLLWVGKSLETCRISQMFSALSSRTSAFIDGPKEQKLIMPWLTNTGGWHFAWNVPFLLERNPGFKSGTKLHPIKKNRLCIIFGWAMSDALAIQAILSFAKDLVINQHDWWTVKLETCYCWKLMT